VKFIPWDLAHVSIRLLVLPSRISLWAPEAGAIAAMVLAALWVLRPLAGPRRLAVYERVSGTHTVFAG
jgi:hypothetical protein